jgi:hypothetical protein
MSVDLNFDAIEPQNLKFSLITHSKKFFLQYFNLSDNFISLINFKENKNGYHYIIHWKTLIKDLRIV